MAYVHEFGIIDNLKDYREDSYGENKYKLISVDGDLIDEIYFKGFGEKMKTLKTYFHNPNRPSYDLAWYGITLIPITSLEKFLIIVKEENKGLNHKDFNKLIHLINKAIKEEKWIVHYGI